eukprot:6194896-Pleurochrysis_carterae.AAC.1
MGHEALVPNCREDTKCPGAVSRARMTKHGQKRKARVSMPEDPNCPSAAKCTGRARLPARPYCAAHTSSERT